MNIELVDEMKILGNIVTNNLSWNQNTQEIIKKVHKECSYLRKYNALEQTHNKWSACGLYTVNQS